MRSLTVKTVFPGSDTRLISPLCKSRTIEYVVESPSPVPFPGSFVVKNGSKMRDWILSGTPGPLSEISTTTHPWSTFVRMVISPFAPKCISSIIEEIGPHLIQLATIRNNVRDSLFILPADL